MRCSTGARNRQASCPSDGKQLFGEKSMGLVADIFTEDRIKKLPGHMAIGHNRYSTTGDSVAINIQPILVNFALGGLAIAHNGNLVNAGHSEGRARGLRFDLPVHHGQRGDHPSDRPVPHGHPA